jgi:hypothetical protein
MGMKMRKTFAFLVALAAAFWMNPANSAGTIAFSLSQQLDNTGKPLANCQLYTIQAGTTSTPQNSYKDSGLTLLQPNPMSCDAFGRLPQFFLADGQIKVRLTDVNGNQVFAQDNILVIGPSSGAGAGGSVDPTTILATGDFKMAYGTGPISGFVRCNARTIGSATSGATERANADTSALFSFLWGNDPNLAVSGGHGTSSAADFAANKTIALPDCRSRTLAGLDDMGNTAAGRFTSTYFGSSGTCSGALATTLGIACGGENKTILTANLPPYTPSGSIANGAITTTVTSGNILQSNGLVQVGGGGSFFGYNLITPTATSTQGASTFTGAAQGGTSAAFSVVQPTMLLSIYIKL